MGAKVSAEMKHALHLVQIEHKSPYEAAKLAGVHASSIYKAMKPKKKKKIDRAM